MRFSLLTRPSHDAAGESPASRHGDQRHRSGVSASSVRPRTGPERARRVRRAPGIVHQHTGDVTALIDLRRGRYFTLNEVGGLVWELLAYAAEDPPLPIVESIAAQIAAEYDVSVDRVRSDVTLLLRELAAAGLVTSTFEP